MKLLSFDTETTGVDYFHGACPYFITLCSADAPDEPMYWEWDVDPLTRKVDVLDEDVAQIKAVLDEADELVAQNSKFDAHAFKTIGIDLPWHKVQDTLMAGHLLASNQPHDLTSMSLFYLGVDIEPLEKSLERVVQECRRLARRDHRDWAIAEEGRKDMPSAKEKTWKYDGWLPRAYSSRTTNPKKEWTTVLRDYANVDSSVTLMLWQAMRREIEKRGLWTIYQERMKVVPIAWGMERRGVTINKQRADELREKFKEDAEDAARECLRLAKSKKYDLELPKSGNNKSLLRFCFGEEGPKIISGGQNGVDQAALRAARDCGLETGGTAPRGWRTLDGRAEVLKSFGLKQHKSPDYPPRTKQNVEDAEATLQLCANFASPGEICTTRAVEELGKPFLAVDLRQPVDVDAVAAWVSLFKVVNVAGNSEVTCPGIGEKAYALLLKVFQKAKRKLLDLPVVNRSELGSPSLDKASLDWWAGNLEGERGDFCRSLLRKRQRDTAITYLDGYERFWVPYGSAPDWYVLHPSLNPTGSDTLRWSSSNPNSQNIGKQKGLSLRWAFGPAPGREWWSLDYENLELRIPSYESGEKDLIAVFDRPDDPPYYGSYHLVVFSVLWPDEWKQHGKDCKEVYKSTLYQWVKNGNFALIYGAQRGTADRTYHKQGAYDLLRKRFPKIAALNDKWTAIANKTGYVETIPDKTVNPTRGYPLMCSRTDRGGVSPTVPLNYHVQSTAMWCTMRAMIRCEEILESWRRQREFDAWLTLQVHDELVFDLPAKPNRGNLWRVNILKRKMERSGDDIGVPLKVSVSWNPTTWSEAK